MLFKTHEVAGVHYRKSNNKCVLWLRLNWYHGQCTQKNSQNWHEMDHEQTSTFTNILKHYSIEEIKSISIWSLQDNWNLWTRKLSPSNRLSMFSVCKNLSAPDIDRVTWMWETSSRTEQENAIWRHTRFLVALKSGGTSAIIDNAFHMRHNFTKFEKGLDTAHRLQSRLPPVEAHNLFSQELVTIQLVQ